MGDWPLQVRAPASFQDDSDVRAPRNVSSEGRGRPAYLPAQADDFVFDDPALAAEWAAIAR